MQLPTPGQFFQTKYQVHQVIGKGGFATVFRATDTEVRRDVAIKILSPRDGGYPDAVVARFMREARLLAGLQDPHTITLYDFGNTDDGLLYMVFEYIRGLDLAEMLKRRGRMSSKEVAHIVKQVLFALREAHEAGVFHRDIKPANLLIYEYGGDPNCVKLLDFGVAKPDESHPMGAGNLTREGALVGTPRYMAPEQIYGRELTPSADIYSLGLVAYEMLTGNPVMDAKTNKERVRQQLSDEQARVPTEFGTPDLRRVIDRMIQKEPGRRYQSAADALRALRSQGGDPLDLQLSRDEESAATLDESLASMDQAGPSPNYVKIAAIAAVTVVVGVGSIVAIRAVLAGDEEAEQIGRRPVDLARPLLEPAPAGAVAHAEPVAARSAVAGPDAGSTADPGTHPPTATRSGCGTRPSRIGLIPLDTMIGLRRRTWHVYVPEPYDRNRRYPVLLMFHQSLSDSAGYIEYTRMTQLADKKGLILVAVDAEDDRASWRDVDNYELVGHALDQAKSEYCVDESRVYAIGHGRGGFFARDLGCFMPLSATVYSGSGQHVGEIPCTAAQPPPAMRLWGNKDPFIPKGGGRGCLTGNYVAAKDIDQQWADRFSCGSMRTWFEHPGGTCREWVCEDTKTPYLTCELNGGHDWPGAVPNPLTPASCLSQPADFPYHDVIWQFFEKEGRTL